jgi:microcystin-dependent protein
MGLETASWIDELDPTNPTPTDPKSQGDDHIRMIKQVLLDQFPDLGQTPVLGSAAKLSMIGAVQAFAHSTPIDGWQVCNGQELSREDFANLFAVIGTIYGDGDGSTTFNLPDYRGQFLRGQDSGAGIDPDAADRTDRGDGTLGDQVGTKQEHMYGEHNHTSPPHDHSLNQSTGVSTGANTGYIAFAQTGLTGKTAAIINNNGGNETRPTNIYVEYRIAS